MRSPLLLAITATSLLAPVSAQCQPPSAQTFSTLYQGTTYLGSPDPVYGANMLFDLTCGVDITVTQIALNLYDTPGPNPATLLGEQSDVVIWTFPGTWVGNHMVGTGGTTPATPPGWTQVGAGIMTVAASNQPSVVALNAPFTLTAGTYGVAIQHLPTIPSMAFPTPQSIHPLYTNPASAPGTPTVWSDQFITLTAGAGQGTAFTSGVAQPRVINCDINYSVPANTAYTTPYGTGCYDQPRMVYEQFPAGSMIDLVNTQQTLIYNAAQGRWVITQGGPTYNQFPLGMNAVNLVLGAYTSSSSTSWDDATVNMPVNTTTFGPNGIQFPGGNTLDLGINSNGKVYLGAVDPMDASFATHGSNYGSISPFQGLTGDGDPTLAVLNCDLDPSFAGAIWYEDPSPQGGIRITWDNVPNWQDPAGPPAVNNFIQVEFVPGGLVYFSYGNSLGNGGSNGNDAIVGFSAGNGEPVSPQVDWSNLMAFSSGNGLAPPTLGISARPVLGTAPTLDTTGTDPATIGVVTFLSLGSSPAGIGLGFAGAAGCSSFVGLSPVIVGVTLGTSASVPFGIPNNNAFLGAQVFAQAAPVLPPGTLNPAGVTVTNGLCLSVGN